MKPTTLLAAGLIVAGLVALWRPTAPSPERSIAPPNDAHVAIVAPVSAKLAGHPNEARQLAAFYEAAADTIRRDSDGARILKTTGDLRTFCERAVTLRFQLVFSKVPGLAAVIHGPEGALAKMLGLEAKDLDHSKAADAMEAIAWACREAAHE